MAEIKPAEISAILRQVEGFESGATLGSRQFQVRDCTRIYGLSNVQWRVSRIRQWS
jgi:hypothetical protein